MNKAAVITGGAQGIGRGCAEYLIGAGWRVACLDADAQAVAEITDELGSEQLLAIAADVADEEAVARAFERVEDWTAGGGLDLLFNNAGMAGAETGPVEQLDLAEWRRRIDASLTGTFLCTRAAVPALRRRGRAIVNMASPRAFQSEPHCEAYAAAKGGIVALTHALAVSLGPDVRVNAVAPGWIETRPFARRDKRQPVEHDEAERLQHPAGRVGTPRDIAEAIEWLTGAGFVTGQTIVVDGGMQKRMIYEA